MANSMLFYFKLILGGLKKHQLGGILRYAWEKNADKKKQKRINQYLELAISPETALNNIFPEHSIDPEVFKELEKSHNDFINLQKNKKWPTKENPYLIEYGLPIELCRFLHSVCFYSKFETIVETGVANGFSSSYILLALDKIKKGILISIDGIFLPWQTEEKIGQAIPKHLKSRHKLIIGDSTKNLEEIFNKYSSIDIFIHDSDHTYRHMMREFKMVWPHIKKGGFLLSDDVTMNDAFLDFTEKINHTPIIISKGDHTCLGMIKKN